MPPGTTHNTEHVFGLEVPEPVPVTLAPREHLHIAWLPWREAAARCFSWSNRAAILMLPLAQLGRGSSMKTSLTVSLLLACLAASPALAQTCDRAGPHRPTVDVSASATATLAQRPHARVAAHRKRERQCRGRCGRREARMARALAKLKALPAIKVATSGYSTDAIIEKGKPTRWRVSQAITLDSADFAVLASAVGKLQDDGMLLSGLGFSLSDAARKAAEDSVTQTGDQGVAAARAERGAGARLRGVARRHVQRADQRRRRVRTWRCAAR